MAPISLSTVIVAHDSLADLRVSLPRLLEQLGPRDEVIVVDSGSTDGLAAELARLAPRARLISPGANIGFAAGANHGAATATGDLVILLNPDAVVQPGWYEAIRAPWGGDFAAWMGLVLLEDGRSINTSGGVLHFTGFGWAGQVGEPIAAGPLLPTDVGFLSGACLAIPRTTWQALGGFCEHFFMYCEDVDLSLRLRLRGARLGVAPDARVTHSYEFAKGAQKWRLLERNRWATIIRTYPSALLVVVAPGLMVAELAVWATALRGGWGRMKMLAVFDLGRAVPRLRRERRAIQAERRITASSFATPLVAALNSPYLGRAGRQPIIRVGLDLYWRLARAALRADGRGNR
jgi:N-acetylglucosaminyl-diphospho-decaprenol L-rhamnosyltransferase